MQLLMRQKPEKRNSVPFFERFVHFFVLFSTDRVVSQVRRVQKEAALIDVMTDIPHTAHVHFSVRRLYNLRTNYRLPKYNNLTLSSLILESSE